jgi:hypothetical protein
MLFCDPRRPYAHPVRTPELPRSKADYLRGGMSQVQGWLNASTAVYLTSLEVLQRQVGVHGDVCEIGVHHGKTYLTMAIGLPAGEGGVAIDVFGDQAANLDHSGKGDQAAFEGHLDRLGLRESTQVIAASSLVLEEQGFLEAGRRFRMFSVDGGHTADVARNDLELAERTIVEDGIVVLDDVLNRHWLGVISGLFDYWNAGGTLVPAVLIPDRLVLTSSEEQAAEYRKLMDATFAAGQEKTGVPIGPGTVDVYWQASWVVRDTEGGEGLLPGPGHALPREEPMLHVPESYLRGLEQQLHAPLSTELARRYPGLATVARPVVRPVRRLVRRARR